MTKTESFQSPTTDQAPKADRTPTAEEEKAADDAAREVDLKKVATHEEEMIERGKNVKGEGEITPPK